MRADGGCGPLELSISVENTFAPSRAAQAGQPGARASAQTMIYLYTVAAVAALAGDKTERGHLTRLPFQGSLP